jgi:hypothetical protein
MRHADAVEIVDEQGKAVRQTPDFIARLFDEELERLLGETKKDGEAGAAEKLREARRMSEEMIRRGEFDPA